MSDDPNVTGGGLFGMSNSDMFSMFSGLKILQSAFAGFGQYQAGQAQKAAYNYNAQAVLNETQQKESDTAAKFGALIGRQTSLYAKAGVDISSGSPLLIAVATAMQAGKQETAIEQAGQEQYNLDKYYAKESAWAGTMGGVSTFLEGLSSTGMAFAKSQMPLTS